MKCTWMNVALLVSGLILSPAVGAQMVGPQAPPSGPPPVEEGAGIPTMDDLETIEEVTGSLAIRAVQGTPGGAPIGSVPVEVQLVHRGMVLDTIEDRLDEHGVLVLDVPVNPPAQPVIRIDYAGVTYQQVGGMMDRAHAEQKVDVTCYEVTNEPPAWHIKMRHVMLSHVPDGLKVTEIVVVENPALHTWLGTAEEAERLVTLDFPMPPQARDVSLGNGFHGWCCTTAEKGRLVNHLPLMPQSSEYNFSYVVAADSGRLHFDLVAPADIDHMMLIVPADIALEPIPDLALGGTEVIADTRVQYYIGGGIEAGQTAHLALAGLSAPAAVAGGAGVDAATLAKYVGGIGGGMVLLVAAVFVLTRSPKPARIAEAK